MSIFDRFRRRRGGGDEPPKHRPTPRTLSDLQEFLRSRQGVEGYIEPPTAIYEMTLVLVAGDGEYLRRPVKHDRQATQLCRDHGVPVYDARIVGYPKRMRDYDRGLRQPPVGLGDLPPLETTDEQPRGEDD